MKRHAAILNLTLKKMKKIIFLDIDGVLNSVAWFNKTLGQKQKGQIDPDAVSLLNELRGCEIVLTSSWGNRNGETEKTLKENGLEIPIIDCTVKVHHKFYWACRGNEIEEWILRNGEGAARTAFGRADEENFRYVILDDDSDMLLGQAKHFIHINNNVGISAKDIEKAKAILKLN